MVKILNGKNADLNEKLTRLNTIYFSIKVFDKKKIEMLNSAILLVKNTQKQSTSWFDKYEIKMLSAQKEFEKKKKNFKGIKKENFE